MIAALRVIGFCLIMLGSVAMALANVPCTPLAVIGVLLFALGGIVTGWSIPPIK